MVISIKKLKNIVTVGEYVLQTIKQTQLKHIQINPIVPSFGPILNDNMVSERPLNKISPHKNKRV